MKNIKTDSDDSLRAEYKRSDFGELVQGKYATTQIDFHQLVEALLACIGEDMGVTFVRHSIGNRLENHKFGDWTYEIDNGNQVTLRHWLSEFASLEEATSNPSNVMTSNERSDLQQALEQGTRALITKVAALE
jgi:hypothetical protein